MRRLFWLVLALALGFTVLNRNRLFLRDPLGVLDRGDERVADAKIFINYSNEILVQEGSQIYLVQAWNKIPGVPVKLSCLQGLLCLSDADQATTLSLLRNGRPAESVVMSSREVTFVDGAGIRVRVTLR